MLTNPIFYKIEKVGKAKRKATARGKQIKAGRAIIEARLDEEHRQIPFDEGRLKARQVKKTCTRETKRRSVKKNNYRKHPQRKKAPALEEVPEDIDSSDLSNRRSLAKKNKKKGPATTRKKTKKVATTSEEVSDEEVPKSSDDNAPDLPSVRVLRRRRVIISEDREEEDELEDSEEDEMDEVEDELDYMDVDDDDEDNNMEF